jgi:hypothetical protein
MHLQAIVQHFSKDPSFKNGITAVIFHMCQHTTKKSQHMLTPHFATYILTLTQTRVFTN